ncbi:hypothetical protein [Streptomyces sp. NBC_01304]|uniref:hypothetical protein n=1 Tax=Streptomyces sp. NBC_01304 TaxID=2903818 RepID=UPI002E1029A9|nr:hypothetical protein OG430_32455 [Streptomyces sp. NBC_01304]
MYDHQLSAPSSGYRPTPLYEAHVTVRCEDAETFGAFERWAAEASLKVTHIVLARGRTVSQPMLTLRDARSYEEQLGVARAVAERLRDAGFEPVRIKVETAVRSPEVPRDADADRFTFGERHFEHHVKLLLDAGFDRAALTGVAVAHGAHLSWNARRVREGGRHERFLTQRCFGVGAESAGRELDALLAGLSAYEVVGVEREFVLYDSDLSVDDGWIEPRNVTRKAGAVA